MVSSYRKNDISQHQKVIIFAAATSLCCCSTGEMPEWSIGAVSKTVVRVTGPWVRIPLSPQQTVQAEPH